MERHKDPSPDRPPRHHDGGGDGWTERFKFEGSRQSAQLEGCTRRDQDGSQTKSAARTYTVGEKQKSTKRSVRRKNPIYLRRVQCIPLGPSRRRVYEGGMFLPMISKLPNHRWVQRAVRAQRRKKSGRKRR